MELRHLRYFLAVADELNFTRAAARLGIAQPPLSQQIKRLEGELGTRLFDRSQRHVSLTEAGKVFDASARRVMAQVERGADAARRAGRGEEGRLDIGFAGSAAYTSLPSVLRSFIRKYPAVSLTLHEQRTPVQVELLLAERIDIGIVRSAKMPDDRLAARVLLEEEFVVALPKTHSKARQPVIELRSLESESFVLYPRDDGPGLYRDVVGICQQAGFHPRHVQHASQITTILAFVASGLGVALLPKSIGSIRWPGVTFRPLSNVRSRSIVALAWRRDSADPAVRKFIDVVVDEMTH